jgi:hypothetical protein
MENQETKPMSKKQTTIYNHYQTCKRLLNDIYMRMICFQNPYEWLHAEKKKFYENYHYKKLTNYYKAVLSGMDEVLWYSLRNYQAWIFVWEDAEGEHIAQKWEDIPEDRRYKSTDDPKTSFLGIYVWIKKQGYNKYPEITMPLRRF